MQPVPMYAPAPPRPRRFPFILTGLLLAFATVCVLTVIGAGAAALVCLRAAAPHGAPSQTGELFLMQMAAGRYVEASRLVVPEFAGSVAGLGQGQKAVWGENHGCSRMSCHSGFEGDNCGFRQVTRATMEYDVKGTDGVTRRVKIRAVNGLIDLVSVDGQALIGPPNAPTDVVTIAPAAPRAPVAPAEANTVK